MQIRVSQCPEIALTSLQLLKHASFSRRVRFNIEFSLGARIPANHAIERCRPISQMYEAEGRRAY